MTAEHHQVDGDRSSAGRRSAAFDIRDAALHSGVTAEARFVVDDSMLASFDGVVVHPALSTVWLIYHLELAGRRLILPFLSEDEEGIGHAISVVHRAPALAGTVVVARAQVARVEGIRVIAAVEARTLDDVVIAEGEFTQVILLKSTLLSRLSAART